MHLGAQKLFSYYNDLTLFFFFLVELSFACQMQCEGSFKTMQIQNDRFQNDLGVSFGRTEP